jgi:hypothetical protein
VCGYITYAWSCYLLLLFSIVCLCLKYYFLADLSSFSSIQTPKASVVVVNLSWQNQVLEPLSKEMVEIVIQFGVDPHLCSLSFMIALLYWHYYSFSLKSSLKLMLTRLKTTCTSISFVYMILISCKITKINKIIFSLFLH